MIACDVCFKIEQFSKLRWSAIKIFNLVNDLPDIIIAFSECHSGDGGKSKTVYMYYMIIFLLFECIYDNVVKGNVVFVQPSSNLLYVIGCVA